jgi:type II secretory pathway component PulM
MLYRLSELLRRIGGAFATLFGWLAALAVVRAMAAAIDRLAQPVIRMLTPAYRGGQAWYQKREPHERLLLKAAGAILGVLILYNFIYTPVIGLQGGMQDRVAARQRELVRVRGLMTSYNRLNSELAEAEKGTVADKNFSLFSVIEQTLNRTVGRGKIGSITPSDRAVNGGFEQHVVELKLNGLTLPQIVDTLYGVQSLAVPVTVANLHIRQRTQDSYSYDVDMTCMALGRG